MEQVQFALPVRGFGVTSRRDAWWRQPLLVALGLGSAIAYMTWAAFQGAYYEHSISRPCILQSCLATRYMRGLVTGRTGGPAPCRSRQRFSFSGPRPAFD